MSAKPATAEKNGVTLIRLGVGKQAYALPEGATLADLLRTAQVQAESQAIYIDGRPIEEHLVVQDGMVVTIVPKPKNAATDDRWRETIGMFADDPTFQEMVDAGRAIREADRKAAQDEREGDA